MSIGVRFFGPTLKLPHRKPRTCTTCTEIARAYGYWLEKRARHRRRNPAAGRRAKRLLTDNGRVVGVECLCDDGTLERYRARGGVVLSCGDFSSGREMKQRYARPELVNMKKIIVQSGEYRRRPRDGDGTRRARVSQFAHGLCASVLSRRRNARWSTCCRRGAC
jgi:hypothetical protein